MAEPPEVILDRIARARKALEAIGTTANLDATDGVVAKLLTDLRHLVDHDPTYQRIWDASRLDWYRDVLADAPGPLVMDGVPRAHVWRHHLEAERMIGDYWRSWPEALQDAITDDCVDAEAAAVEERLAALTIDTSTRATWNPLTGLIELLPRPLEDESPPAPQAAFDRPARHRLLAEAFGSVLDRYRELEDAQVAEFIAETTSRLEERGYQVDVYVYDSREGGEPETNYAGASPYHRTVELNLLEHNEDPLPADAQALADFADFAERLPPLEVDPSTLNSWHHRDYIAQAFSAGGDDLADEDFVRFLAALANARTEAVNMALIETGHVWDPRISHAVPLPNEAPRPLTHEQHAEVEAAKATVDPVAVYRTTFGDEPRGLVAAAFPAQAAATAPDTGPTTEPEPHSHAPQPGL